MAQNNINFEGTVQETMLGPLWARAKYSKLYPELLDDQKAIEIMENINYDFSKIQEYLREWRGLGLLVRAKSFAEALLQYIEKYPNATVVNMGAGLDTTFYSIDNGKIKWYDLDLPSAIEYRKRLLPESERNIYIPKSALDYSWFKDIEYEPKKGTFFIAGGFVYYFKENEISSLIIEMAKEFPGAEMIFDATSKLANKVVNKRAKKVSENEVRVHFGVGDPTKVFPKWSPKIKVHDWHTIWARTMINPNWNEKTIAAIKISERVKAAKIVRLNFVE